MLIKKEFNQKKMELDVAQREYREIREKIKNSQQFKDTKSINEFNKTEKEFKKIKEELNKMTKEHGEIKEQIVKGQSSLQRIRKQQVEVGKELDETNSRLNNAKEKLNKKDQLQDTRVLTPKGKKDTKEENSSKKTNAGGFYLRTLPTKVIKNTLKNYQSKNMPGSFYIHSWELTPEFMPKLDLPFKDKFTTYHNQTQYSFPVVFCIDLHE
jgi:seryl-tRNA synthetase